MSETLLFLTVSLDVLVLFLVVLAFVQSGNDRREGRGQQEDDGGKRESCHYRADSPVECEPQEDRGFRCCSKDCRACDRDFVVLVRCVDSGAEERAYE